MASFLFWGTQGTFCVTGFLMIILTVEENEWGGNFGLAFLSALAQYGGMFIFGLLFELVNPRSSALVGAEPTHNVSHLRNLGSRCWAQRRVIIPIACADIADIFLHAFGINYAGSALYIVFFSSVTVWTALLRRLWLKRTLARMQWLSVILITVVLSVTGLEHGSTGSDKPAHVLFGIIMTLGAAVCDAFMYVLTERALGLGHASHGSPGEEPPEPRATKTSLPISIPSSAPTSRQEEVGTEPIDEPGSQTRGDDAEPVADGRRAEGEDDNCVGMAALQANASPASLLSVHSSEQEDCGWRAAERGGDDDEEGRQDCSVGEMLHRPLQEGTRNRDLNCGPTPNEISTAVGAFNLGISLAYVGIYSAAGLWRTWVTDQIDAKGGDSRLVVSFWVVQALIMWLHYLTFYYSVGCTSAVAAAVNKAVQSAGIFLLSAALYCNTSWGPGKAFPDVFIYDEKECMTPVRVVAVVVVCGSVLLYAHGYKQLNAHHGHSASTDQLSSKSPLIQG